MNPYLMSAVLVGLWGAFFMSAERRIALLGLGAKTFEDRLADLPKRLEAVWTFALYQKKMRYYFWAGIAHNVIFVGFSVLLLRTLILWGRGFDPSFSLFVLGLDSPLGIFYNFLKDVFALLVISGVLVFVYYRTINRQKRMTLSGEGLLILCIILTMMVSDMLYDGSSLVLASRYDALCSGQNSTDLCGTARDLIAPLPRLGESVHFSFLEPGGSLFSLLLQSASLEALTTIGRFGFWAHSTLVLVFLNILPYSKHFHIITAVINVFLGDTSAPGRLRPLAKDTEELMAKVEKASESEDIGAARLGYARIDHFSWKDMLDFYTCTECGRCSDNCPAALTGKKLSPKQLTLDLRNHLYGLADLAASGARPASRIEESPRLAARETPVLPTSDLVPDVVDPDVLWACTTCRACEEQCPVNITYVDKIVQMRRNLVTIRGDFPAQLSKPFEGMETNGNPWNLSRLDRAKWTEGLEIPTVADHPEAEVLYWVGCAASYDDRAKKIARATALLLKQAGVDFAILAEEETCTGDPARRAGNEYLYSMLAETNVATINGYKEKGGIKTILSTCPHCFNTLKNEYPDFGGHYEVVHHTDYLLGLLAEKKLDPKTKVKADVVYHDSCYLGRYNGVYDSPREILTQIGASVREVERFSKNQGLCCGAGGAQMFMEEQNHDRVNVMRTKQLMDTGATTIASACPFCMTMLTDGVKAEGAEDRMRTLDVVELLAEACLEKAAAE